MRKIVKKLSVFFACLFGAFLFVSCDNHKAHIFGDEWCNDETSHWHICEYEGCDVISEKQSHEFMEDVILESPTPNKTGKVKRVCSMCGYVEEVEIKLADLFGGGAGTELNPYLISTPTHLQNISLATKMGLSGAYFRLVNDIDMTGKVWTPIGEGGYRLTSEFKMFSGSIEGCGFTIKGLSCEGYVAPSGFSYQSGYDRQYSYGFIAVCLDSIIKNIVFENVFMKTSVGSGVGTIVGSAFGGLTIKNCVVKSGSVSGLDCVGGLVGRCYAYQDKSTGQLLSEKTVLIDECINYAQVDANTRAGGIAGAISFRCGASFVDCENYGAIHSILKENGGASGICANIMTQVSTSIDGSVFENTKKYTCHFDNCKNEGSLVCDEVKDDGTGGGTNQLFGFWGNGGSVFVTNCSGKLEEDVVDFGMGNLSAFLGYGLSSVYRLVLDSDEFLMFFNNSKEFLSSVGLNIVESNLTSMAIQQMYNRNGYSGGPLEGYNNSMWHKVVES